jgi:hypothetical protein
MSALVQITGFFTDEKSCAEAIEALHQAGLPRPRVYSPVPSEKIMEALHTPKSPIRLWVLGGGITGATSGFALTIGLSVLWPHYVGGKPLVSLPPFVIIAFELMILFGALSGFIGFLLHGRFPASRESPGFLPRFNEDQFGIVIDCLLEQASRADAAMHSAGAGEVVRVEL